MLPRYPFNGATGFEFLIAFLKDHLRTMIATASSPIIGTVGVTFQSSFAPFDIFIYIFMFGKYILGVFGLHTWLSSNYLPNNRVEHLGTTLFPATQPYCAHGLLIFGSKAEQIQCPLGNFTGP
jgi:hypothetical protein